ncbi:hypothetical protein TH63_16980 [Rufibacter radiotolerans]|uniref:Uncharacterized protein n=1 Tax=Rufibacter radiotolerans TaxID=1379910 RepID=A0A0H4VSJ8_9BACT|nr:hypothetical protein TH63_16980 [Rufibacter radiotolerans]
MFCGKSAGNGVDWPELIGRSSYLPTPFQGDEEEGRSVWWQFWSLARIPTTADSIRDRSTKNLRTLFRICNPEVSKGGFVIPLMVPFEF